MYHYTESGLNNHYLLNGYDVIKTAYGRAVVIQNVEHLHYMMARSIVESQPHMTGREFKFIRKQMNMTQQEIAELYGCDAQTVARWEKAGRVPKPADRFIRYLFLGASISKSAENLAHSLSDARTKIALELGASDGWRFEPKECAFA